MRQTHAMASVFSRVIAGEFPGAFVYRDERCVAFLSINPISVGHVLVVPIEEVDHWLDLEPELVAHLMTVAHRIGRAQQSLYGCERVAVIIAGFEVPHCHIHVIAANDMSDVSFAKAGSASMNELMSEANALSAVVATIQ
jgi:histidine triad (HIT) family protein